MATNGEVQDLEGRMDEYEDIWGLDDIVRDLLYKRIVELEELVRKLLNFLGLK